MKRFISLLCVCVMTISWLSLVACEDNTTVPSPTRDVSVDTVEQTVSTGSVNTPEPTVVPEPTMEPDTTLAIEPTPVPSPELTPVPTPEPSAVPTLTPTNTPSSPAEPAVEPTLSPVESPAPTPTPSPTPETIEYDPAEPILYTELLEKVNKARQIELETENTFDGFEEFLVNDPATATLLTDKEVELLRSETGEHPESVTYEEAVYDIDLLFRALHMAYGAYYFFGEEAFRTAEAEVMDWLKGQETVNVEELRQCLRRSTNFMRDGHSWVAVQTNKRAELWYEYFRCEDQGFSKDETGYYKTRNGEKWYFVSFSDENISMQPTLLETGELVYAPVLFCTIPEAKNGTVTLKNTTGTVKTEKLIWKDTTAYRTAYGLKEGAGDYKFFEENGISYISIRSGHESQAGNDLVQFADSGTRVQDSKVLILDIRSHGGGGSDTNWQDLWVKNFTGEDVQFKWIRTRRSTAFQTNYGGEGYLNPRENKYWYSSVGKFIENDVPIILLVDDEVGSGGESTLNAIKTLDNVLVVGSNSAGYQLGGDAKSLCLPNTQIACEMGTAIGFFSKIENVDCKGYEPDVWCDPQYALEAALNLIDYYDLADTKAVEAMWEQLDGEVFNRTDGRYSQYITLLWGQDTILAGANFGGGISTHTLSVQFGGTLTDDFVVESTSPDVCVCTKKGNGIFELKCTQRGESIITVTCGKYVAQFNWQT